jgi:hypothetical protein
MNLKPTSKNRDFTPNISFTTEDKDGKDIYINNLKLDPSEQIVCEVKLASIQDKTFYSGTSVVNSIGGGVAQVVNPKYARALTKYCKKIRNLEVDGKPITTGAQLVEHEPHEVLTELIQEIFPKIMGTYAEVEAVMKKLRGEDSSEDEEHTPGEDSASN